jgi:hypothetical protein
VPSSAPTDRRIAKPLTQRVDRHLGCGAPWRVGVGNDWSRRKLGTVALLHAGIKRVAIDVGDRQVEQFGMAYDPCAVA